MTYKYIYLSHEISDTTPTYGNRDHFSKQYNTSIANGDTANSCKLFFSTNHLGTHIDLPFHFYENGKKLDKFEPESWFYNSVSLVDFPCNSAKIIAAKDLQSFTLAPETEILLIRTGFERFRHIDRYWKSNPGIHPDVAFYLRDKYPHLRTIGFDFISLTSYENRPLGKEAHQAFLGFNENYITVVEDMSLKNVQAPIKKIIIAPLLIGGIDSSPVTAIAKIAV